MGKPVGSPKTGGRKKGTPNAKFWGFLEVLQSRGIEPLGEILDELQRLSGPEKIKVYIDLLPYLYPKRRPTDQTLSLNEIVNTMSRDELRELWADLSRRLGYDKEGVRELTRQELEEQKKIIEKLLAHKDDQELFERALDL